MTLNDGILLKLFHFNIIISSVFDLTKHVSQIMFTHAVSEAGYI